MRATRALRGVRGECRSSHISMNAVEGLRENHAKCSSAADTAAIRPCFTAFACGLSKSWVGRLREVCIEARLQGPVAVPAVRTRSARWRTPSIRWCKVYNDLVAAQIRQAHVADGRIRVPSHLNPQDPCPQPSLDGH